MFLQRVERFDVGDEDEHVALLADEIVGDDLRLPEATDGSQPEVPGRLSFDSFLPIAFAGI